MSDAVIAHEWHSNTSFNGVRLYFCVHCRRYIGPQFGSERCLPRVDAMPSIDSDDFIDEMNVDNYIRREKL